MNAETSKPTAGAAIHPLHQALADTDARALMSALCDGDAAAAAPACAAWAQDEPARRAWHEYHLIGDVLRSDDLALQPQRDAAFLAALRTRLAQEPVPLAPQALVVPNSNSNTAPRRATSVLGWRAPAAVAAGFAAVAAVIALVRPGAGAGGLADDIMAASGLGGRSVSTGPVLVSNPTRPEGGAGPAVAGLAGVGFVVSPESLMIRNPQLDAHLRAHQAARLRAEAEPSTSSLRDSPILMAPDLVAAHAQRRVPQSRVGFGSREPAP
jgi:sigma-E factor negative regulatory protein RseA